MNIAIILAGGSGSRLSDVLPKQYIVVNNKPIFSYCMVTFNSNKNIDKIVIVAEKQWRDYIDEWIEKENITKFFGYADAGKSRQHSIFNSLEYINENIGNDEINVFIHDAARPNVTDKIIDDLSSAVKNHDGALPILQVTDTIYYTNTSEVVNDILNRDKLCIGQTPECFNFKKYLEANKNITDEEMSLVRGAAQLAFQQGLEVRLVPGDSINYKITTKTDLQSFKNQFENNGGII